MRKFFLNKSKYHFDRETLSFRKVDFSSAEISNLLLSRFMVSLLLGIILSIPAIHFIETPRHKNLTKQNQELRLKYELLDRQVTQMASKLYDIQKRDNNAYRTVFEADTIPRSIFEAGTGGSEKYADIAGKPGADRVIETFSKIDKLARQLIVQSKSFDELVHLIKETRHMQEAMPTLQPVANKVITGFCPFGMRVQPILKIYRPHNGVDLCAAANTHIYAPGAGTVSRISFHYSLGNYIEIQHGYGIKTVYGHLNKSLVQVGQKVKRGDLIALMGTTGLSNVVHLHYEIHKNGTPMDPVNFYYNDISDADYEHLVKLSTKKPFSEQ